VSRQFWTIGRQTVVNLEAKDFAQLANQYKGLEATHDFQEDRDAEAQDLPAVYIRQ